MLTAKNLERVMELEEKLRSEYQVQLDAKTAELESCTREREQQQAVIAKQLEQIQSLSTAATSTKKIEQRNRELHARCENLQEDIATVKKRVKSLQKDLVEARAEASALKQYDPARMKKNLDANKKKLAEKTAANDLLQKSLKNTKAENAELQASLKALESKLAELTDDDEDAEDTSAAA